MAPLDAVNSCSPSRSMGEPVLLRLNSLSIPRDVQPARQLLLRFIRDFVRCPVLHSFAATLTVTSERSNKVFEETTVVRHCQMAISSFYFGPRLRSIWIKTIKYKIKPARILARILDRKDPRFQGSSIARILYLISRILDFKDPRLQGYLISRILDCKDPRLQGSLIAGILDYKDPRLQGSSITRILDCKDPLLQGSSFLNRMVAWILERKDPRSQASSITYILDCKDP